MIRFSTPCCRLSLRVIFGCLKVHTERVRYDVRCNRACRPSCDCCGQVAEAERRNANILASVTRLSEAEGDERGRQFELAYFRDAAQDASVRASEAEEQLQRVRDELERVREEVSARAVEQIDRAVMPYILCVGGI